MPAKPKITEDIQFKIERILRLWEGKLTWDLLTQRVQIELGLKVTRQTLEDYDGIYSAYKQRKHLVRSESSRDVLKKLKSQSELSSTIEKLKAEIELKDKTINEQKRFLQRILQNAAEIPALKGKLDILIAERPEDKI